MFEPAIAGGVLRVRQPRARWLSTGWNGGFVDADAAYNVSVPEGWHPTDIGTYVEERRREAGFAGAGPSLLTAVDMDHARGARSGPVTAVATAGLSNPASLPMEPGGGDGPGVDRIDHGPGTVNLILTSERAHDDAALANLLEAAVEARTATLLGASGFAGTTTDATVVGCDPAGEPAAFAGSATEVGAAARACVREAVLASLGARYADSSHPDSVEAASDGVTIDRRAEVFRP